MSAALVFARIAQNNSIFVQTVLLLQYVILFLGYRWWQN